jgi:hypothetical protein
MADAKIKIDTSPSEFFREQIHAAFSNQRFSCSDETEFYLVNLLCEFISPSKLSTSAGEIDVFETPLVFLIQAALEAPPSEQVKIYKVLGDTSLYLSGFFQDYCLRKTIDIDYFATIGSHAYRNVSTLIKYSGHGTKKKSVFDELSDKFPKLVDIVADVADSSSSVKSSGIVALYQRWTQAPSERLRKLLVNQGVIPLPVKEKNIQ